MNEYNGGVSSCQQQQSHGSILACWTLLWKQRMSPRMWKAQKGIYVLSAHSFIYSDETIRYYKMEYIIVKHNFLWVFSNNSIYPTSSLFLQVPQHRICVYSWVTFASKVAVHILLNWGSACLQCTRVVLDIVLDIVIRFFTWPL